MQFILYIRYMQRIDKNCTYLTKEEMKKVIEYLPKREDLNKMEQIFSALAMQTRLKIICALSVKRACVSDLQEILSLNQTTLSHQLAFLKNAGIIDCERYGKTVVYYISNTGVFSLLSASVDFIEGEDKMQQALILD